jgi:hypothetical protein
MDILNKFKENLKKADLKDKTIKNYTSDLNTVLDIFDYSDDFLKTPEASIKKLEEHYPNIKTLSTKINIIIMLFQLNYKDNESLKKFYDEYVEFRNQLRVENEEYYNLKIANPKQLEQAISNEEIDTIKTVLLSRVRHSIKNRLELNALRDFVFFCFICDLRSRTDFITSYLVIESPKNEYLDETNYIVLNRCSATITYIQSDYKTAKTYGTIPHEIDKSIYKWFIKLYNGYKKLGVLGGYAFYQSDLLKPMNCANASKLFHDIGKSTINKSITIQSLRLSYASSPEDIEALERIKKKARRMGHGMPVHTGIYMKTNMK